MPTSTKREFIRAAIGTTVGAFLAGCTTGNSGNENPSQTSGDQTVATEASRTTHQPTTPTAESSTTTTLNSSTTALSDTPKLHAADQTAQPGSDGVITITGENIASVRASASDPTDSGQKEPELMLDTDDVQFSPHPNEVATSYPPYWIWQSPQQVTIKIPYQVSQDTPAGDYNYSITGWTSRDSSSGGVAEEFIISVRTTTERSLCTEAPVTEGTAVYEGTSYPCSGTEQTRSE